MLILGFQVCGSDNVTYPTICNLLQTTVDVQIAFSGPCESEECTSIGEVSSESVFDGYVIFIPYRSAAVIQ